MPRLHWALRHWGIATLGHWDIGPDTHRTPTFRPLVRSPFSAPLAALDLRRTCMYLKSGMRWQVATLKEELRLLEDASQKQHAVILTPPWPQPRGHSWRSFVGSTQCAGDGHSYGHEHGDGCGHGHRYRYTCTCSRRRRYLWKCTIPMHVPVPKLIALPST